MTDPKGLPLPQRLEEILSLASDGLTDKQIAQHLNIRPSTVESHWKRLRRLFDSSSRIEILARALQQKTVIDALDRDGLVESLRAEIATRRKIEEALRRTVEERDRLAEQLLSSVNRIPLEEITPEHLGWLRTMERAVESCLCVVYHSQWGAPWRKFGVTENSRILGVDPRVFTSSPEFEKLFYAMDVALGIKHTIEAVSQQAHGLVWEYRIRFQDGWRWMRDQNHFRYVDGSPIDYTGVCTDVTDLKRSAGQSLPMTPLIVRQMDDWIVGESAEG